MKLNKNIDYGSAMKSLFQSLKFAEEKVSSNDEYKYPNAYGRLSGGVRMFLVTCTNLSMKDIDKALNPDPNDIPAGLFEKPGNEDLENTLN